MINETIDERKQTNVVVRLEDSLKKIVKEKAKMEDRSLSNYIRNVLKDKIEKDN